MEFNRKPLELPWLSASFWKIMEYHEAYLCKPELIAFVQACWEVERIQ
jgi:hypothetical protein